MRCFIDQPPPYSSRRPASSGAEPPSLSLLFGDGCTTVRHGGLENLTRSRNRSQILTCSDDLLDVALRCDGLAHQGLDVDDPLALLARDFRPVVRVRRVGQVFVLLELLADGGKQIRCGQALLSTGDAA